MISTKEGKKGITRGGWFFFSSNLWKKKYIDTSWATIRTNLFRVKNSVPLINLMGKSVKICSLVWRCAEYWKLIMQRENSKKRKRSASFSLRYNSIQKNNETDVYISKQGWKFIFAWYHSLAIQDGSPFGLSCLHSQKLWQKNYKRKCPSSSLKKPQTTTKPAICNSKQTSTQV